MEVARDLVVVQVVEQEKLGEYEPEKAEYEIVEEIVDRDEEVSVG